MAPGGKAGDPVDSWINPTSIVVGVLAVCRRAMLSAVAVGIIGMFVLYSHARYLFDGVTPRGSAAAAPRRRRGRRRRPGAAAVRRLSALHPSTPLQHVADWSW